MNASSTGSALRPQHHIALGLILGIVVAFVIVAVVLAPIALTHHTAGTLETAYGSSVVYLLTRIRGAGVGANPVSTTQETLAAGATAYGGSCSQCHGATGQGNGEFAHSIFPPATDLTSSDTRSLRDGQLFYIIKNGLGFTPMPGYGTQYSDDQIWEIVSYLRTLQTASTSGSASASASPSTQPAQVPSVSASPSPAASVSPSASGTSGDANHGEVLFQAYGCAECHGNGPGQVAFDTHSANDVPREVRNGDPQGMPCFSTSLVPDSDLPDLEAYVSSLGAAASSSGGSGGGAPGGAQPAGGAPGGGAPGGGTAGGAQPTQQPSPCASATLTPVPAG